jgi:lysophospholipase L1-like esterase
MLCNKYRFCFLLVLQFVFNKGIAQQLDSIKDLSARNNYFLFNALPISVPGKLNIVHIGDSHIQAGYWGNVLISSIDSALGTTYEPLLLPHRFIKGQLITSQTSIQTFNEYSVKSCAKKNYDSAYTHLSYFKSNDSLIGFIVKHPNNSIISFETNTNYTFTQKTNLGATTTNDTLYYTKRDTGAFMLWNIAQSFPNANTYYNLGLNGASYKTVAKYMHLYTPYLKNASVVLLSLGANDGYNTLFDSAQCYRDAIKVINECYTHSNARIIITNAGHSQYNANELCTHNKVVNALLKKIAVEYNLTYWDWYSIMGSEKCIAAWVDCNLARNDYIHLTPAGYGLQAKLFTKVFMRLLHKL